MLNWLFDDDESPKHNYTNESIVLTLLYAVKRKIDVKGY